MNRFGLTHISLGDLVRREIQSGSSVGRFLSPTVAAGDLVPKVTHPFRNGGETKIGCKYVVPFPFQEVVLAMLKRAMLSQLKTSRGFIIDGFPRDEAQVVAFEEEVRSSPLRSSIIPLPLNLPHPTPSTSRRWPARTWSSSWRRVTAR